MGTVLGGCERRLRSLDRRRRRDQVRTIRGEGRRGHAGRVLIQHLQETAPFAVPEDDRPVVAARGDDPGRRVLRDAHDRAAVLGTPTDGHRPVRRGIPEMERTPRHKGEAVARRSEQSLRGRHRPVERPVCVSFLSRTQVNDEQLRCRRIDREEPPTGRIDPEDPAAVGNDRQSATGTHVPALLGGEVGRSARTPGGVEQLCHHQDALRESIPASRPLPSPLESFVGTPSSATSRRSAKNRSIVESPIRWRIDPCACDAVPDGLLAVAEPIGEPIFVGVSEDELSNRTDRVVPASVGTFSTRPSAQAHRGISCSSFAGRLVVAGGGRLKPSRLVD